MNFPRLIAVVSTASWVALGADQAPAPKPEAPKPFPCKDAQKNSPWCQMDVYRKDEKNHRGLLLGTDNSPPQHSKDKNEMATFQDLKNNCLDPRGANFGE
ncbi:hypothetical protein PTTG_27737 [Puccinia triticina 1-1 BBBD Race 1]|uniref:Uncharacterized protein n=1 Tax=Puccinia triticina (isolate 1-1 / race 1 (BBBD)) TaxID=630390 RepID=A0A180GJN2_PUCT1|nr:hypothetical protein PTTG_27737 [Puccinia triticina 1-1 BBBD Race 1]WAR53719.1 hypothetical protein PtB15_3B228 [Puccinia triticina]